VAVALPSVYIERPLNGSTVSGTITVKGWAIDNASTVGTAIGPVQVQVDGTTVGNATYGLARSDVCTAYPGRMGCPNVGFSYLLNTTGFTQGPHTVTVCVTDTDPTPDTGCQSVAITVGPSLFGRYNLAPASRTVRPVSIYTTSGNVQNPSNFLSGNPTRLTGSGSYVTVDFAQ